MLLGAAVLGGRLLRRIGALRPACRAGMKCLVRLFRLFSACAHSHVTSQLVLLREGQFFFFHYSLSPCPSSRGYPLKLSRQERATVAKREQALHSSHTCSFPAGCAHASRLRCSLGAGPLRPPA